MFTLTKFRLIGYAAAVLAAILIVVKFQQCAHRSPEIPHTETAVEIRHDTGSVAIPPINIDSLQAEILQREMLLRVTVSDRQEFIAEAEKWRKYYFQIAKKLQDAKPGSAISFEGAYVDLDTVLMSFQSVRGKLITYHDTLRARYTYWPVNAWTNMHAGFQARQYEYSYPIVTTTTTIPESPPLIKGMLLGGSVSGNWRGHFVSLSEKRFEAFVGLTLEQPGWEIDLIPVNAVFEDVHAEIWYKLNVRLFAFRSR